MRLSLFGLDFRLPQLVNLSDSECHVEGGAER